MKLFRPSRRGAVDFEEILLDSSNLPSFNQRRFEGKRELPISPRNLLLVGGVFSLIALWFLYELFTLQVLEGAEHVAVSDNNSIDRTVLIAERGVIFDRHGELLAWNEPDESEQYSFPVRAYTDRAGLGQVIGYVSYPLKDAFGQYFRTDYVGRNGVESAKNDVLAGTNGQQLVERDALGEVIGEHVVDAPTPGRAVTLTLDAELSEAMFDIIATSTTQAGFRSGAAAIMNVHTGEIIAMTSFPSYDPEVMSDGDDVALIEDYNNDSRFPFLNKVFAGAYTPGSIVKPFVAYAAMAEGVISSATEISSNGQLVIPNPYSPSQPTRFADWRTQGTMTIREAIAFSSNVFFYIIGGGLPEIAVPQAGLTQSVQGVGITKLYDYFTQFGFGEKSGVALANEQSGTVPNPAWKEAVFQEEWRLGNTYHTSIGQFGWQVTPLQMLVAYGALANGGTLHTPRVIADEPIQARTIELDPQILRVVREGMRMTVNFDGGTARSLERSDVAIAAKSGTAEIGAGNEFVNSWAAGYWPYEDPQYSFILMMDQAPRSNALGATRIMGDVVEWMSTHRPEYLGITNTDENELYTD